MCLLTVRHFQKRGLFSEVQRCKRWTGRTEGGHLLSTSYHVEIIIEYGIFAIRWTGGLDLLEICTKEQGSRGGYFPVHLSTRMKKRREKKKRKIIIIIYLYTV